MIDVHAHFAEEGYDVAAELGRIRAAGVDTVILAADTLEHARMHRDIANVHTGCFFTVGVHPEFAQTDFSEEEFFAAAAHPKCVAVGEIGLDYHYPGYDKTVQLRCLERQIGLAESLGLPVQIHSRDACADTLAVLREFPSLRTAGFLMHCYSYGAENLDAFLACGAYFSFGGVVCFKNARRAAEAVGACPRDRLLSETDSPYLSPFRGEKNSPANIPVIVKKLAELKGMTPEAAEACIAENAVRLFPRLLS